MLYIECDKAAGSALCSDDACPCSNTTIPRGEGYLYISRECCEFRGDCLTLRQAERKIERLSRESGRMILPGYRVMPVLCCEEGATRRNLDLGVAAADARHWWETGKAPLRMTPAEGEEEVPYEPAGREDIGQMWLSFGALIVLGFLLYQCGGG